MVTSQTQLTVANYAMELLGAEAIAAVSDGSNNGDAVGRVWNFIVDKVLSAHNWNFATRRVQLTANATNPTHGYDNSFDYPANWVKTVAVFDNDNEVGTIKFSEEMLGTSGGSRVLMTDSDAAYMTYIVSDSQSTSPANWPPAFATAVAFQLAAELAISVANSNKLRETLTIEAGTALLKAMALDAKNQTPPQRPRGSWAVARGGTWGYGYGGSPFKP